MGDYKLIATEVYKKIGQEAILQIRSNQKIDEVKLVRVNKCPPSYHVGVLQENKNVPAILNADFVGVVLEGELEQTLDNILEENSLPEEVRLIRSTHRKYLWGIFFKQ